VNDAELEVVRGAIPPGLRGVLFRNGPAQLTAFGTSYAHPFDGDGLVRRFSFDGTRVTMRSRFVRTRELIEEEARGARLYRSLGTNAPGGVLANVFNTRFKNAANTSVALHGGRLLALWEGGLPHVLDPVSLDTCERSRLGGVLDNPFGRVERWLNPDLPFGAHPKVDPASGTLVNIGVAYGVKPRLLIYRLGSRGEVDMRAVSLRDLTFVHDFVLAGEYVVVFLNPLAFGMFGLLSGLTPPIASVAPTGGDARILVISREGEVVFDGPAPPRYVMHCVNGFVAGDDVVFDAVSSEVAPPFAEMDGVYAGTAGYPTTTLTRYTCSLGSGRVRVETRSEVPLEFPTVRPSDVGQPYRTAFALSGQAGRRFVTFDSIARIDCDSGAYVTRSYDDGTPGEPIFAPGGRAGFLLTMVSPRDQSSTWLDVLDAETLASCCRLQLPGLFPPDLHGVWSAGGGDT